jgi:hypothetical protein
MGGEPSETTSNESMANATHMTWAAIRDTQRFQGRWVALAGCLYDRAHKPLEASVVDADENLSALFERLRKSARANCDILFCDPPPRGRH